MQGEAQVLDYWQYVGTDVFLDDSQLYLTVLCQARQNVGVGELAHDVLVEFLGHLGVGGEGHEL
jgi:hypothetical protein